MPSSYFESDRLRRLDLIFARAIALLERYQGVPLETRNTIAVRIFELAAEGGHDDEVILQYALYGLMRKSSKQSDPPDNRENGPKLSNS
jgi:hypothetical protein